jgi:hypothetical protein
MTPRRQGTAAVKAQGVLALRSGAKRRVEWCRAPQRESSGGAEGNASVLRRAAAVCDRPACPQDQDPVRGMACARLVGRWPLAHDRGNQATPGVHHRSRPQARAAPGAVSTLLCAGAAVGGTRPGAAMITSRGPGRRPGCRRPWRASPRQGRALGTGGSPPWGPAHRPRATARTGRGGGGRGACRVSARHAAPGHPRAPRHSRGPRTWCQAWRSCTPIPCGWGSGPPPVDNRRSGP